MSLPITTLYALPLIAIWLPLWFGVSAGRANFKTSIGDGGQPDLLLRIRRHGNFIEWVPFLMVLMVLAEAQGTGPIWLHVAGALVVIGRLVHPIGLKIDNPNHPLRIAGNSANLLSAVVLAIALIRIVFGF